MKNTQKVNKGKKQEEKKKGEKKEVKKIEVPEKKNIVLVPEVIYSPRLEELQVSKPVKDKILVIYSVLSQECSYEEILHSLKEFDYDEQTVINNYFEGKISWKQVEKKDKKEKKRPEIKNKKGGFDKKKKFEKKEPTERKLEKKEKKQQGPTIKSYVQPEIEENNQKTLSYSQIVQEKPKIKKREEEEEEQTNQEPEIEKEEEEEQQEQVDLNTYDDFSDDTVILPDSTKDLFIDDLQFGSLDISEKETKKPKESSWDFQNQDSKKKQKFVPNQQPYYPNQFYPYMMPPNMQFQNSFRYNPYAKNPNMFYGTSQQQFEEMMQHYYSPQMMQNQQQEDTNHKKESNEQNFENSEYQGYHYGMPFPNSYMYPYMMQPQQKKNEKQNEEVWNRKNFGQ